jgi:hypothetical protein
LANRCSDEITAVRLAPRSHFDSGEDGDSVTKAPRHSRRVSSRSSKSKADDTNNQLSPHVEFFTRFKGTFPEVITQSDLGRLNWALSFLFAGLREASRQFYQETDDGRSAAFTALGGCWQFIALFDRPLAESLHVPIVHLMDALVGLENNLVLQIVKPTPRRGRSPSSHKHATLRGHVAGTVNRLQEAGLSANDAFQKVAKHLNKLGLRPQRGSGPITTHTVRNWCNEVSSDFGRHGTAARMHDSMLVEFERQRFASLPKEMAADFALNSLISWVRTNFPPFEKST